MPRKGQTKKSSQQIERDKAEAEYFKNNPHMQGETVHLPPLEDLKQLNESDKKSKNRDSHRLA